MTFRTDVFLHNLFGYDLANAALVTLWVSVISMALGSAIPAAAASAIQRASRAIGSASKSSFTDSVPGPSP